MNSSQNTQYKNLRVLVVDDHMVMRNLISQNLRDMNLGFIEIASNGEDAIKEVERAHRSNEPYHIILLDWSMPVMDGLEVLQLCRKEEKYNNMAVIMLTAKKEEKNVLEAIQNGATSYITKPTTQDQLEKHIDKTILWLEKQKNNPKATLKVTPKKKEEVKKAVAPSVSKNKNLPVLSQEIFEKLEPVVMTEMKDIFSSFFNVKIIPDHHLNEGHQKDMVCIGRLHQKDVRIALRFVFTQDLLRPLLSKLYSEEYLDDKNIYEDAACEIVNILCNQVKAFLNKYGYDLEFDIPEMDNQDNKCSEADSVMNVSFSLKESDEFYVDISSS